MMQFSNDNFWQKSSVNGVKLNERKFTLCKKAKSLCEWCPSLGLGGFLNIHMD